MLQEQTLTQLQTLVLQVQVFFPLTVVHYLLQVQVVVPDTVVHCLLQLHYVLQVQDNTVLQVHPDTVVHCLLQPQLL